MSTVKNDWLNGDADVREAMLTAYALGEFDGDAEMITEIEAMIAADPALADEVVRTRETAGALAAAFTADAEAIGGLGEARRAEVSAGRVIAAGSGRDATAAATGPARAARRTTSGQGRHTRWMLSTRLGGGLALAATVALVAIVSLPEMNPAGKDGSVAIAAPSTAAAIDGMSKDERLALVRQLSLEQRYDEALEVVNQMLREEPQEPSAITLRDALSSARLWVRANDLRDTREMSLFAESVQLDERLSKRTQIGSGAGLRGMAGTLGAAGMPVADDAFAPPEPGSANPPPTNAPVPSPEVAVVGARLDRSAAATPRVGETLGRIVSPSTRPVPVGGIPASGGDAMLHLQIDNRAGRERRPILESARFYGEAYDDLVDNAWTVALDVPLSTFSIDVDTAAYANVRRFLMGGSLPPADAVRIEELINAFDYDDPQPEGAHPFSVNIETGAAPWAPDHRLVRIGLKGLEMDRQERPAANLVFLVDVSGSMRSDAKIGLVKASLRMLVETLGPSDRVAIVTYAGRMDRPLESTPVTEEGAAAIRAVIDGLEVGGGTNGAGGIQEAYRVAAANMIPGGVNRVILCTDGDFNVGVSDPDELQSMIESKRETGVFLSTAGFGRGNLRDDTMERLSNHGNGIASYIDSMREAERAFVRDVTSNLVTIAKDVKIQVDFNPAKVQAYRLIGYANRRLAAEDFANDEIDAGEIGAGHSVTALYEVIPHGVVIEPAVDPSKYQRPDDEELGSDGSAVLPGADSPESLTVRVRYKQPDRDTSVRFDTPHVDGEAAFAETSGDFQFAAAVAGFGMKLRGHRSTSEIDWDALIEIAGPPTEERDPHGDRAEFLALLRAAKALGG